VQGGDSIGLNVPVRAGQEFGRQRDNPLDFSVFAPSTWNAGFLNPFWYATEPWKPYLSDPLPFFRADLAALYGSISQRTEIPRWGGISWDVAGSAQGNWFIDGTLGYSCLSEQDAMNATAPVPGGTVAPGKNGYPWCPLALVPHQVQSSTMMVSIGMWQDPAGDFQQFMILPQAGQPAPKDVTASSGTVVYKVASSIVVNADGSDTGPITGYFPIGYKLVPGATMGLIAIRVNPNGTLTVETRPGVTDAGAFGGFSAAQRTYRRDLNAASNPRSAIDTPANGARLSTTFSISGWATDLGAGSGPGVDAVHVYAYPNVNGVLGAPQFVGVAAYGGARGDLGAIFGARFTNSAFSLTCTLPAGTYRLVAYARSTLAGSFNGASTTDVTIAGPVSNPLMSLDGPRDGASISQPFITGGWAVDLGASSGTGIDAVHVWAFPVVNGVVGAGQFVDAALLGGVRPDVGAVFGPQFAAAGFNFLMTGLAPGQYYVGVYVHSSVTGTFNQQQFALVTIVK
jgi:hypothetical protein